MPNHMLQFNNRSLEMAGTIVKLQAAATFITMMMKKKHISSYKRFFLVFESIDLLYTTNDLMLLSYVPKVITTLPAVLEMLCNLYYRHLQYVCCVKRERNCI